MTDTDDKFAALLLYLKESRGVDFTGINGPVWGRRVHRRMALLDIDNYAEYHDYLEVHPREFTALFNTILINVTHFFRDFEAREYLRQNILPSLVERKPPTEPIRLWSAGCASGEEPYSLAILLAEALGPDDFRARVKIYATDVDEEALTYARQASYSAREVRGLPEEYLDKYFERNGQRFVFSKDLRRSVIFGRNDLVQDAPISRIDLLVCRNTLRYFNAETQARILSPFHFALTPEGILFLGRAEMLLSYTTLFAPVDLKRRVFRKLARTPVTGNGGLVPDHPRVENTDRMGLDRLREEAFLATPMAEVVVTSDGVRRIPIWGPSCPASAPASRVDRDLRVHLWNRKAEDLWGMRADETAGKHLLNLDIGLPVERLRPVLRGALSDSKDGLEVSLAAVNRRGREITVRVVVSPLRGDGFEPSGAILVMEE